MDIRRLTDQKDIDAFLSENVDIVKEIRLGEPLSRLAVKYGKSSTHVRSIAKYMGWNRHWVTKGWGGISTCGSITKDDVVRYFNEGKTLEEIGQIAGVCRERIRQVTVLRGCVPRHKQKRIWREEHKEELERQEKELEEQKLKRREERKIISKAKYEARLEKLRQFLTKAHELWIQGHTHHYIAEQYGILHNSMSWYIHTGRKLLGWFEDHREVRKKLKEEKFKQFMVKAREMWALDSSRFIMDQIAEQYHISKNSLIGYIRRARRLFGVEWFPYRSWHGPRPHYAIDKLHDYMSKARVLWREGHTICEIAKIYEVSEGSINAKINRARRLFEWFPCRKKVIMDKDKFRNHMMKASKLWCKGHEASELATVYKITVSSMYDLIGRARKMFGAYLFPYRIKGKDEFRNYMNRANNLWEEGKKINEIAEIYEVSRGIMAGHIGRARKSFNFFAFRCKQKMNTDEFRNFMNKAHDLWEEGKKIREIAEIYKINEYTMSTYIYRAKKLFGTVFFSDRLRRKIQI